MPWAPVRSIRSSQAASRNSTVTSQKAHAEMTTSQLPRADDERHRPAGRDQPAGERPLTARAAVSAEG
jgi:hypothetical protein